jgi:hypothetical protein
VILPSFYIGEATGYVGEATGIAGSVSPHLQIGSPAVDGQTDSFAGDYSTGHRTGQGADAPLCRQFRARSPDAEPRPFCFTDNEGKCLSEENVLLARGTQGEYRRWPGLPKNGYSRCTLRSPERSAHGQVSGHWLPDKTSDNLPNEITWQNGGKRPTGDNIASKQVVAGSIRL